jgi:hypothetical protein
MFEDTPSGFIIHDKNTSFSLVDATFNTEVKAGVTAAGINRVTPLMNGITDYQINGGDVKTSQEGFGPETPIGINAKRIDYTINKGGLCLLRQLKKLNGRQVRIFPVDKKRVAYGTVAVIGGVETFRGFLATLWIAKRDNNGSQTGAIIFSVFYDANYEEEESNMAAIALDEVLEGLTGVILKKTATGKAKFVIACSGDDLTDTFGSTLADADLYVNAAGSPPSTVTYTAATKELTFTPAAAYAIADAATLAAANIEGYEGEEEYTNLA